MANNVFPQLFKMKETKCAIECPAQGCHHTYNSLILFERMATRERARYISILEDVAAENARLKALRTTIHDMMTLKCPTCKTPVDPLPDACSAVMCLSCGHHYCNYCFAAFATGVAEKDRGMAHTHAASHSEKSDGRDPFLPAELVEVGQRLYRKVQLEKCLSIAMCSMDYSCDGRHEVALAIVLCAKEIQDMGINIVELWYAAEGNVISV